MEWWQTLIVALVPVVVTSLALIYQQRRADDREAARRRADADDRVRERQHQRELAAHERTHAVSDTWREERKTAHAEAISVLVEYQQELWALVADRVGRVPDNEIIGAIQLSPEIQALRDRGKTASLW
jgi:hypothetical protein